MEAEKEILDNIQSVKGMKLGDNTSYIGNALDDLDNAQIDPGQLNFPVPKDINAHLREKREEAAEALKTMDKEYSEKEKEKRNQVEEKIGKNESKGDSKSQVSEDVGKEAEREVIKKESKESIKSPSWSDHDSPDHKPLYDSKKLETLEPIKEEERSCERDIERGKKVKSPAKPKTKRMAAKIYIKRDEDASSSNQKKEETQKLVLDEYGTHEKTSHQQLNIKAPGKHSRKIKEHVLGKPSKQNIVYKKKGDGGDIEYEKNQSKREKYDDDEDYYEDQYDWNQEHGEYEEEYEDHVVSYYLKSSSELVDSINTEFSNANIYPSDDHTDHIFYLHNTEGMTDRDVYFYTMGVSKERSISFAKKSMDIMMKLEGLLALANKNMNHTTTNLKISETNISALHSCKKDIQGLIGKTEQSPKWTIKTTTPSENENKRGESQSSRGKEVAYDHKQQTSLTRSEVSRKPGSLVIREPGESSRGDAENRIQTNALNSQAETNVKNPEQEGITSDDLLAEKIAALHSINMSDKLLENEDVLGVLLPMVTTKLIEKIKTGDTNYKATVLKILLKNLREQVKK